MSRGRARSTRERRPLAGAFALRRAALLLAVLAGGASLAEAAVAPVNRTLFGGLAIDGYDPVAYFLDGRPVEGRKEYTHDWQGATWRFASAAHRDLFVGHPEAYAPQYGGYCAWAVSQGTTAGIDPAAWTIHDGKLYLNYDLEVRERWLRDVPGNVAKGDVNWPRLLAGH